MKTSKVLRTIAGYLEAEQEKCQGVIDRSREAAEKAGVTPDEELYMTGLRNGYRESQREVYRFISACKVLEGER